MRRILFSSQWRHQLLQQRKNTQSTTEYPHTILANSSKRLFKAGLFLLGGSIAGTMYHYTCKPSYVTKHKAEYMDEKKAATQRSPSTNDLYRWTPETEVKIEKEFQPDEKSIRSHLSAIGFAEMDVNLILQEKKMKNKKLKISEILDELIEKYEKNEKKIVKDGGNKIIKIKDHKTMAIEETSDGGPDDSLSTRYQLNGKYEQSSAIWGKQELGVKVITQLEVESKIVDKLKQDDVAHNIYTTLFALYAASACVFAFNRRADIFMTPVFIFFHYFLLFYFFIFFYHLYFF